MNTNNKKKSSSENKKILVACEESQAVTKELRELGFEAYSCDVIDQSGGHPEWHIMQDVLPLLNGNCTFKTTDGEYHTVDGKWDMLIAFPPCTNLAVSGARYFEKKRTDGRQRDAIEFFCQFLQADCERIAIENPVNIISGEYILKWFPDLADEYNLPVKPTQRIQPYEFGHPYSKKTCLWLKGLPKLVPTEVVEYEKIHSNGRTGGYSGKSWYCTDENGKILAWNDPMTAKLRSKTYPGIAKAMADQWTRDWRI